MKTKKKRENLHTFDFYLSKDESILWIGRPNPMWLLGPDDIFLIPFSLVWGGFALFWEAAVSSGGTSVFCLWGIPFVVLGQYFIWGRFIYKYLRRQKTYYAITDQRALVLEEFFGTNLKTYFLHKVAALQCRGRSVLFEIDNSSFNRKSNRHDWSGESQPGFYALAEPHDVYNLLQELLIVPKHKHGWD